MRDRKRSHLLGHEIVWVDRDGPGLKVEVSKFVGWPLALHGAWTPAAERVAAQALERVGAQECARSALGRAVELAAGAGRARAGVRRQPAGRGHRRPARRAWGPRDRRGLRPAALADRGVRASLRGADERLGHRVRDVRRPGVVDHAQADAEAHVRAPAGDGEVIPFPDRDRLRAGGSRGVGCCVDAGTARTRQALPGGRRRAGPRCGRRVDDGRGGRVRRALRSQRLGQDDAARTDRWAEGPRQRHGPRQWPRRL